MWVCLCVCVGGGGGAAVWFVCFCLFVFVFVLFFNLSFLFERKSRYFQKEPGLRRYFLEKRREKKIVNKTGYRTLD